MQKFCFNQLSQFLPLKDWKAEVSSARPSSEHAKRINANNVNIFVIVDWLHQLISYRKIFADHSPAEEILLKIAPSFIFTTNRSVYLCHAQGILYECFSFCVLNQVGKWYNLTPQRVNKKSRLKSKTWISS